MWVFCCGMERSGSTVQFQIAAEIVEMAGVGTRVDWVPPQEFPASRNKHRGRTDMLVFKNHICTPDMVAEFDAGNARGLYIYRDLRDVMVSKMRKTQVPFGALWNGRFLTTCLNNYDKWTRLPGVLVSRYEDMVGDLASEVDRIASHLGIELTRQQRRQIANRFGLERQQHRINAAVAAGAMRGAFGQKFDPHTNLHSDHIHSAKVGAWLDQLTHRQIALVEQLSGQWLIAHGYSLHSKPLSRHLFLWEDRLKRILRVGRRPGRGPAQTTR
jgi:hypothetical protein